MLTQPRAGGKLPSHQGALLDQTAGKSDVGESESERPGLPKILWEVPDALKLRIPLEHPGPFVCSAGEVLGVTSEQSGGKSAPKNKTGQLQRWVCCLAGGNIQAESTAGMLDSVVQVE